MKLVWIPTHKTILMISTKYDDTYVCIFSSIMWLRRRAMQTTQVICLHTRQTCRLELSRYAHVEIWARWLNCCRSHVRNNVFVWASCQIRKIAGAHAPGMPGTFSPSPQVSDLDMHHGTCVTHVPWCMPGSLTSGFLWNRRRGEMFPAFPAHAQPAILRIW